MNVVGFANVLWPLPFGQGVVNAHLRCGGWMGQAKTAASADGPVLPEQYFPQELRAKNRNVPN